MTLIGPARRCGIAGDDLHMLMKGVVTTGVARRLNVPVQSIQRFIDGKADIDIAGAIGFSTSTLQQMRFRLGREGAIGVLIGLMLVSDDA